MREFMARVHLKRFVAATGVSVLLFSAWPVKYVDASPPRERVRATTTTEPMPSTTTPYVVHLAPYDLEDI